MAECKESSLRVVEESAFSAWRDKKYDVAIRRYEQACEMCPENIKYLTRTAEIYFEQQKYEECVDQCVKAIGRGTEHNAYWEDVNEVFTLLGKAQYQIKKVISEFVF